MPPAIEKLLRKIEDPEEARRSKALSREIDAYLASSDKTSRRVQCVLEDSLEYDEMRNRLRRELHGQLA
jgi:hypothetical protein